MTPTPPAAEVVEVMAQAMCEALYPGAWPSVIGNQRAPWLTQATAIQQALTTSGWRLVPPSRAAEVDAVGWQDISTAPKTSRSVMVWCPERKNTFLVSWGPTGGYLDAPGWRHFGGRGDLMEEPSHWRPLPTPPSAADAEGG